MANQAPRSLCREMRHRRSGAAPARRLDFFGAYVQSFSSVIPGILAVPPGQAFFWNLPGRGSAHRACRSGLSRLTRSSVPCRVPDTLVMRYEDTVARPGPAARPCHGEFTSVSIFTAQTADATGALFYKHGTAANPAGHRSAQFWRARESRPGSDAACDHDVRQLPIRASKFTAQHRIQVGPPPGRWHVAPARQRFATEKKSWKRKTAQAVVAFFLAESRGRGRGRARTVDAAAWALTPRQQLNGSSSLRQEVAPPEGLLCSEQRAARTASFCGDQGNAAAIALLFVASRFHSLTQACRCRPVNPSSLDGVRPWGNRMRPRISCVIEVPVPQAFGRKQTCDHR